MEKTSGIGAKLKLAIECGQYEAIGHDLVAMCVNDVVCTGAQPVAFLDYIACGKLDVPLVAQIVKGIADGCREAKCALLGGETAEMPALFSVGSYDLAGYSVGVLDYGQQLHQQALQAGDLIVGLPSSGLHCSGFDHVYDVMSRLKLDPKAVAPFDKHKRSFAQAFLTASRIYVEQLLPLMYGGHVKAAVHVRSGGLLKNVEKMLKDAPGGIAAELQATAWEFPAIFGWLRNVGALSDMTILENFNCGLGLCFVVRPDDGEHWKTISGARLVGKIVHGGSSRQAVTIRNFATELRAVGDRFGVAAAVPPKVENGCADKERPLQGVIDDLIAVTHSEQVFRCGGKRMLRLFGNEGNQNAYKDPILVIGTDGIGSKILIAKKIQKYETIGIDLVAMCVNDILCNGAAPLTFLDYYACGPMAASAAISKDIIGGVVDGVRQSECALIDGKTVEMPALYEEGEFDLAGFALGIVEHDAILPRMQSVQAGDVVIGVPSHGVHSNGFSLVHRVMSVGGHKWTDTAVFSANGQSYGKKIDLENV